MKPAFRKITAIFLLLFGMLTFYLSGAIIFDVFGIRQAQGNFVPFVVWANFICSFIYISAVYGFWFSKKWTTPLLSISVSILILTYIAFRVYMHSGGLYLEKTVLAIPFRIGVTLLFTILSRFLNKSVA
tara:strand:- start:111535 stop:111921 length:387 start_codon:yes stop_codon:yes gene_type:complete